MNIEQIVCNDLKKVIDSNKVDGALKNIHFLYGDGRYEPGDYIYEKDGMYYYIGVGDRGGVVEEVKSRNIEEVLYKIYSGITFNEATKFAMVNREKDKDWRTILFSKQLEMLKGISEIYYMRRVNEIKTDVGISIKI